MKIPDFLRRFNATKTKNKKESDPPIIIPQEKQGDTESGTIRCVRCGRPIFIGDPIVLYISRENFERPEYTVVYKGKKDKMERLVGCLRYDCAESGGDRNGFWVAPGKVQRVLSPMEEVIRTGKTVICNNLSDINLATLVDD